jgi:hypothetical protein
MTVKGAAAGAGVGLVTGWALSVAARLLEERNSKPV